jgi:transposase
MDIVGGLDVHRKQITFDYVEIETGESRRGEIRPADRENLREWLEEFTERFAEQQAAFAVEATTGWRYVVEELRRAGIEANLAEPAETRAFKGGSRIGARQGRVHPDHRRGGKAPDWPIRRL